MAKSTVADLALELASMSPRVGLMRELILHAIERAWSQERFEQVLKALEIGLDDPARAALFAARLKH